MTTALVFHPAFGWFRPRGVSLDERGRFILAPPVCQCPDCIGGAIALHPRHVLALPAGSAVAPSQLSPWAGHG